jgi:predicted RNA-binding protein YlqC (UPF0109 family)
MQEFLDFVLRHLVEFPDDVMITHVEAPRKIIFKVQVRKTDIPKIIGKHGQTIAALRSLLNAAASRHGQKAMLDIIEDEPA